MSGNEGERKHDTRSSQDLIDAINSLHDSPRIRKIPSPEEPSDPAEPYSVSELESGNDNPPNLSTLESWRDTPERVGSPRIRRVLSPEEPSDPAEVDSVNELEPGNVDPLNLSTLENWRDALGQHDYDGLSRFAPARSFSDKTDLSYKNVVEWDREFPQSSTNDATPAPAFNSRTALRQIMVAYIRDVEPILKAPPSTISSQSRLVLLDEALRSVFGNDGLAMLEKNGFGFPDVICWSSIFCAPSVDLAVLRFVDLTEEFHRLPNPRQIPKFVLLQLLRSHTIGQFALRKLVESLLRELQLCHDRSSYKQWRFWETRVCLVVRLLRHARFSDPSLLGEIALIIRHLFSDYYNSSGMTQTPKDLERLAHIHNRFLNLISMPSLKEPFRWSLEQQNAQLVVVRIMAEFKPQLPITREGFRALIKVQLLHKKTADEVSWASAKSSSWPPWRQDKMGIQKDHEYAGKESRAMKLLRRMREAGYAHGAWEQSASILAGWDIDKSPTIQTRSILLRTTMKFFPEEVVSYEAETVDHTVWAARVRSTRSQLEAWAAFSAYVKSTPLTERQCWPYYAMLERLMVRIIEPHSDLGFRYYPGDLKATFTDPIDPNQRVYVEKRVPTMTEFYRLMLHDGFKPAGTLLRQLIDSATNFQTGIEYVTESKFNEVSRDVLLHAEKYPHRVLKQNLNLLRSDFLAAFYGLLCRYGSASDPQLQAPGSLTGETQAYAPLDSSDRGQKIGRGHVQPMMYASQMLKISGDRNIDVWNGFLKGAAMRVNDTRQLVMDESLSVSDAFDAELEVWRCVKGIFNISGLQRFGLNPNLDTFRYMAWLGQILMSGSRFPSYRLTSLVELTKALFLNAVYGQNRAQWSDFDMTMPPLSVPEPLDIRHMVRLMLSIHDIKGLLEMIKWLNHHTAIFKPMIADDLEATQADQDITATLEMSHLRGTLCAIRLFLEGSKGLGSSSSSTADSADADDEKGLGSSSSSTADSTDVDDEKGLGSSSSSTADSTDADDEVSFETPFEVDKMWFETPLEIDEADLDAARTLCQPLRWPTDEEVHEFLAYNVGWVYKVARAADLAKQK